jgi:hypothetical protein
MLTKPRTHEAPTPAACGFNLIEIKKLAKMEHLHPRTHTYGFTTNRSILLQQLFNFNEIITSPKHFRILNHTSSRQLCPQHSSSFNSYLISLRLILKTDLFLPGSVVPSKTSLYNYTCWPRLTSSYNLIEINTVREGRSDRSFSQSHS